MPETIEAEAISQLTPSTVISPASSVPAGPTEIPKKRRTSGRDGVTVRSGNRFYISWVDHLGRRKHRKVAAATLQQARTFREAELIKAERARTLGLVEPSRDSFQQFSVRFLKYQKARLTPAAYERTRGIVEGHLQPEFGARRLSDIRRADVERYITGRTGEVSASSIIKEINTLLRCFNLAVEWELISVNPMARVRRPKQPAGRLRYPQPGELRAVLAECPPWLRPIAGLAAFTGMRRSEVLNLRWLDVDFAGGRLLLPQTKNGDGRIVPLNALALGVLHSVAKENAAPADPVFPLDRETPNSVSMAFVRAVRRAKIADFRFHDLRHTAASWLVMQGTDIYTVAKILGHRGVGMTARYSHLSPAHMATAAARLDVAFGAEMAKLPAWQGQAEEN